MAVLRRRGELGDRADRELARGLDHRRARPARADDGGAARRSSARRVLRVRHALIAPRDRRARARSTTVVSHPQVPGQCTRFLREELPHARIAAGQLDRGGRARVVQAAGAPGCAALGTALAASIYGGWSCASGVEDRDDNETRFVWLGARGRRRSRARRWPRATASARRSLVFWGAGRRAARAGWSRCLDEFARREINLTQDRVAPAARGLGQLHVLRRPRRGSRRGARGRSDRAAAPALRGGARARLLRGCARARRRRPRSVGRVATAAPLHCGAKMESTVPPEPVGSVSPSEHQRHGPDTRPRRRRVAGCSS